MVGSPHAATPLPQRPGVSPYGGRGTPYGGGGGTPYTPQSVDPRRMGLSPGYVPQTPTYNQGYTPAYTPPTARLVDSLSMLVGFLFSPAAAPKATKVHGAAAAAAVRRIDGSMHDGCVRRVDATMHATHARGLRGRR
jgi:hypothetical protein